MADFDWANAARPPESDFDWATAAHPPEAKPVGREAVQGVTGSRRTLPQTSAGFAALKGVQDLPTFGFGDELGAGIQALGALVTPGMRARETYREALRDNRTESKAAAEDHPLAYYGSGLLASLPVAALTTPLRAGQGATLLTRGVVGGINGLAQGGLAGAGTSEADSLGGMLTDAGLGALIGGPLGAALPYVGAGVNRVTGKFAQYAGDKLKNLAGWLKVNSLRPVPTLAEDMAALPGGVQEVGKTLLRKNLGGFTKKGTAEQIANALGEASSNIDRTTAALDASGAEAPDLAALTSGALWRDAVPMAQRPLTEATGQRLGDTLAKYENLYSEQPRSFSEALKFRRELDDAIYKNDAFGAHPELSDFSSALRPLRGDVNQAILESAGNASPELAALFKNANLETRQLGLANKAAERIAGRGTGNHIVSLRDLAATGLPAGAGVAGVASGHGLLGLGAGAGSWLLSKYGSQAGARSLYNLGRLAQYSPELFQLLMTRGPVQNVAGSRGATTLRDLLLPKPALQMPTAYAMEGE